MQLGARWLVGHAPHHSVPELLHATIAAREGVHPGAASWTLTWLEGRPVCTLDDLETVSLGPGGEILVSTRGGASADGADALSAPSAAGSDLADEDDDWLS